jgi:hypothetical protein
MHFVLTLLRRCLCLDDPVLPAVSSLTRCEEDAAQDPVLPAAAPTVTCEESHSDRVLPRALTSESADSWDASEEDCDLDPVLP